jgi:hypothetical protein
MKFLICTLFFLTLSNASFACDEDCKRTQAEATNKVKFASYLNAKYCKSTAQDFILRGTKSLRTYREKQLATAHRGGAKNIRNFVTQRKEWLAECDNYLLLTDQGRIFRDKTTTDNILNSLDIIAKELSKIILRTPTEGEDLYLISTPAGEKLDILFKQVDDHYLELQRRGLM